MVSPVSSLPRTGALEATAIEHWLAGLAGHRSTEDIERLRTAIDEMVRRHDGDQTPDGVEWPLALLQTTDILDQLQLDTDTLVAALLSEMAADLKTERKRLEKGFGTAVVRILELVWRIRGYSAVGSRISASEGIENLRRMLLGMANDVRALLVVLAKRVRLMRGLKRLPVEQQRAIARESQLVHAPLANRLGVWQIKWELEDLSLRYLEPEAYKELASRLDGKRKEREDFIQVVIDRLNGECAEHHILAEITGRPKHIYSIWKKMQRKKLDFDRIFDVRAVRVLVESLAECYEVLGIVHGLWRPIPGEFDDYIARPKSNGYRSLHTAVIGDDGKSLEIQVRTREMHEKAERGVAAHWRYKESRGEDQELQRRIEWMRQWLEQQESGQTMESVALEDIEGGFESRRIYVLTPQARVVELPKGATALDFAYAIHTSVGHRCRGAKIDGRIASLTQPLESGQTVEILTAKHEAPSRDWLNPHAGYLVTGRARNRIKHWFKEQDYDQHLQAGRSMLDREISRLGIGRPDLEKIAPRFNFQSPNDLLAAVGRGDVSSVQIANQQAERVKPVSEEEPPLVAPRRRSRKLGVSAQVVVEGVGDLMTQMAKCCKPVPFDSVIGYITRGHGVTVHRRDCVMVRKLQSDPAQQARLVDVRWADEQSAGRYLVDVHVFAGDRKGLLRDITSILTNEEIDVLGVNTQSDRRKEKANMRFTVEVSDMSQLSRILDKIARVPDVLDVRRQV